MTVLTLGFREDLLMKIHPLDEISSHINVVCFWYEKEMRMKKKSNFKDETAHSGLGNLNMFEKYTKSNTCAYKVFFLYKYLITSYRAQFKF